MVEMTMHVSVLSTVRKGLQALISALHRLLRGSLRLKLAVYMLAWLLFWVLIMRVKHGAHHINRQDLRLNLQRNDDFIISNNNNRNDDHAYNNNNNNNNHHNDHYNNNINNNNNDNNNKGKNIDINMRILLKRKDVGNFCFNGTLSEAGDMCCRPQCKYCGATSIDTVVRWWDHFPSLPTQLYPCESGCNFRGIAFTNNHRVCNSSIDIDCLIPININTLTQGNTSQQQQQQQQHQHQQQQQQQQHQQQQQQQHQQPQHQQQQQQPQLLARPPPRNNSYDDCCNFIEDDKFDKFIKTVLTPPLGNCALKYSEKFFNYRLGDMVNHPDWQVRSGLEHIEKYPTSIAAEYLRKYMGKVNLIPELAAIVDEQYPRSGEHTEGNAPKPYDIVLHLRTGDLKPLLQHKECKRAERLERERVGAHIDVGAVTPSLCGAIESHVIDSLCSMGNHSKYLKPLSFYREIITILKHHWPKRTSIVIVTGIHSLWYDPVVSCGNIEGLRVFFEHFGYKATVRYGTNPDQDVAFMSRASVFVPSGGGFTKLMAALVEHNGGHVVDQGITQTRFPTCNTARLTF